MSRTFKSCSNYIHVNAFFFIIFMFFKQHWFSSGFRRYLRRSHLGFHSVRILSTVANGKIRPCEPLRDICLQIKPLNLQVCAFGFLVLLGNVSVERRSWNFAASPENLVKLKVTLACLQRRSQQPAFVSDMANNPETFADYSVTRYLLVQNLVIFH